MTRPDSSMTFDATTRRLPVGAELLDGGEAHFRVWGPKRRRVEVHIRRPNTTWQQELQPESGGYFSGLVSGVRRGDRYGFKLDDGDRVFPDPASRSQPDGPHELSALVDPAHYAWKDRGWKGPELRGQVLYELHVGTFTPEGTWRAAAKELPRLAELGVTLVEMMPVAEFAGEFGWGYDGVDLYAPSHLYGMPDDLRYFVDEAHRLGLGVILDVVYNHFGPSGNYLGQFSEHYHSSRHRTDWGDGINYDGPNSAPVREFMTANAGYWIDEFHMDGLRLDAVHAIVDDSPDHVLAAIARQVRKAAQGRHTLIFAENELQQSRLIREPSAGGYGLDAVWNDDFHHTARVAMTGHREGYLNDFQGTPQELISAVKWGHLYQGQWVARQRRFRGTPALDIAAPRLVVFLQNHDQVANSPHGHRCHMLASPGRHRAMTALMLLSPGTPLLFQGQEFSASAPFHYFADHEEELARLVSEGRRQELKTFGWQAGPDGIDAFYDPCDRATFEASKLDPGDWERHGEAWTLHRDLLRLRREDPVFSAQRADRIHGSVIGAEAFVLRYFGPSGDDRLLVINLGQDLDWRPAADPLAAPPPDSSWSLTWSSEHVRYGGSGAGLFDPQSWYVPGHCAFVLSAERRDETVSGES